MKKTRIPFNYTCIYMGRPYVLDLEGAEGKITLHIPTVGEIVDLGDDDFYGSLYYIIGNTTMFRALLWDLKMDWNEISDFQMFCLLYKGIDPKVSQMLLGFDVSQFKMYEKALKGEEDSKEVILYNPDLHIEINEKVYTYIQQYYQFVFQIVPEDKFTDDKILKRWWIQKDKREAKLNKDKNKDASLQPLISSLVNHAGFKYNLEELSNVNIAFFYDAVKRLQIFEECTALLKGEYSGFIDKSKIPTTATDWMQDFNATAK